MAAACAGGMVWWGCTRRLHLRRPPGARLAIYLAPARFHLGGSPSVPTAAATAEAVKRVLGPLAGGIAGAAARALGLVPGADLELRLRQAGPEVSMEAYRREYVRWLVLTPLGLGALGLATGRALLVVLFFLAGAVAGARRGPEKLRARARRRGERIRSDLPTVLAVLALKIENNKSLGVALSDVAHQGSGPVVEDLRRGVNMVNAGYGEAATYELLAAESAEPAAARFYRFIAAASGGGMDLAAALLDQANELRTQRREEVERSAARRQVALVVPNLVFMAPVMFAFLLAPLPMLLFGHG